MAPGADPKAGAIARAKIDLPVPESPPTASNTGGGEFKNSSANLKYL